MPLELRSAAMSVITLSRSSQERVGIQSPTPAVVPHSWSWPRDWPSRRWLLERQHGRLEVLLDALITRAHPQAPLACSIDIRKANVECRRLQKALRLHLRLEERWLEHHGCLDAGHRASHRLARTTAQQADAYPGESPLNRAMHLHWLRSLQEWFLTHRDGIDAIAYSRADHSCQQPQP